MIEAPSSEATIDAPLVASSPFSVLDHYRVPYVLDGGGTATLESVSAQSGRQLLWPRTNGTPSHAALEGIPIFAPVHSDEEIDRILEPYGTEWERCVVVRDAAGAAISSVRCSVEGSVFLPFDPNRAVLALLAEEYVALLGSARGRRLRGIAQRSYYAVRPVLPRSLQLALRRRFTSVQQRSTFPDWPIETAIDDLQEWLLALLQRVAGGALPQIGWWPSGHEWAVVLTHDVERAPGYALVNEIASLERRTGLRSAWYFVPERDYRVADELVEQLWDDGFEVGLHGLRHDGKDLLPGVFHQRLSAMLSHASHWHATGFRSPSTQRSRPFVEALGLDHDSSYSDVARFEPQPGGSCSWLPFFIGNTVELPITLPMDHTIFELLGEVDGRLWKQKAGFLRDRGGMALMLTHPDYMTSPTVRGAYEAFLKIVARDRTAWHALPREVALWWRQRAASSLEYRNGVWEIVGDATADGRVVVVDRTSALRSSTYRPSLTESRAAVPWDQGQGDSVGRSARSNDF